MVGQGGKKYEKEDKKTGSNGNGSSDGCGTVIRVREDKGNAGESAQRYDREGGKSRICCGESKVQYQSEQRGRRTRCEHGHGYGSDGRA